MITTCAVLIRNLVIVTFPLLTVVATAGDVLGEFEGIDSESHTITVSGQSYDFNPGLLSISLAGRGAINIGKLTPGLKVRIVVNDNNISSMEILGPKEKIEQFNNN